MATAATGLTLAGSGALFGEAKKQPDSETLSKLSTRAFPKNNARTLLPVRPSASLEGQQQLANRQTRVTQFLYQGSASDGQRDIPRVHSEEYAELVHEQVEEDGGFDRSSSPSSENRSGKFEFVLTGRHATRRCDGDSVEGTAWRTDFYGHAAGGFTEKLTTLKRLPVSPNGPTNSIKRWTGNNARSSSPQYRRTETRPSKQKAPPRISRTARLGSER